MHEPGRHADGCAGGNAESSVWHLQVFSWCNACQSCNDAVAKAEAFVDDSVEVREVVESVEGRQNGWIKHDGFELGLQTLQNRRIGKNVVTGCFEVMR